MRNLKLDAYIYITHQLAQIEEKLKKKQEEENIKKPSAAIKDPKETKLSKEVSVKSSSKDKGPSVKNKFHNDGNFMAQFRQQMKVRVGEEVSKRIIFRIFT